MLAACLHACPCYRGPHCNVCAPTARHQAGGSAGEDTTSERRAERSSCAYGDAGTKELQRNARTVMVITLTAKLTMIAISMINDAAAADDDDADDD